MIPISKAQYMHAMYYKNLLEAIEKLYDSGGDDFTHGMEMFDLSWANIQIALAWSKANAPYNDAAAVLCYELTDFGKYMFDIRLSPSEQIYWLESSLTAARRLGNGSQESFHLSYLGDAYEALSQTDLAIEHYNQALKIAYMLGDQIAEGLATYGLSWAYYNAGDYSKALDFCNRSLALSRLSGNMRDESYDLTSLGNIYLEMGEYQKAVETLESALYINRKINDSQGEGASLGSLGEVYFEMNLLSKAIDYLKQALAIQREIGDKYNAQEHLLVLGKVYFTLENFPSAFEFLGQSLEIAIERGDRRAQANARWNISLILAKQGDVSNAIVGAEAALSIFHQISDDEAENVEKKLQEWFKLI